MTNKSKNIDLSMPRRRYLSGECSLTICPECGSDLIEESCSIVLSVKSDSDEGNFITKLSGSHFCNKCPVVVFDSDMVEQAAMLVVKGDKNIKYIIEGIINLGSIPDNKKHLELVCDENPVPLVRFLPELNHQAVIADKKLGRNDFFLHGRGKESKKYGGT